VRFYKQLRAYHRHLEKIYFQNKNDFAFLACGFSALNLFNINAARQLSLRKSMPASAFRGSDTADTALQRLQKYVVHVLNCVWKLPSISPRF